MAAVSTLGSVTFNTSVSLHGVTRLAVTPGNRIIRPRGDGYLYPTRVYTSQILPVIDFTTMDVATALALGTNTFGLYGIALSAAFSCYLTERTADAGLATTGEKLAVSTGMVVPVRLSVARGEAAQLELRVHARSTDGTTNPLSRTADQTVPASAALTSCHTIGKVMINGSELAAYLVDRIEYDPGIEVITLGGDLYPTKLYIGAVNPRFTIEISDTDALATLGLTGLAQNTTDSVISLRKFDPNGGRVADVTAEHITFTIDDGLVWAEQVEGDQDGTDRVRVIFEPAWDASNNIVVFSAAAAIS